MAKNRDPASALTVPSETRTAEPGPSSHSHGNGVSSTRPTIDGPTKRIADPDAAARPDTGPTSASVVKAMTRCSENRRSPARRAWD